MPYGENSYNRQTSTVPDSRKKSPIKLRSSMFCRVTTVPTLTFGRFGTRERDANTPDTRLNWLCPRIFCTATAETASTGSERKSTYGKRLYRSCCSDVALV